MKQKNVISLRHWHQTPGMEKFLSSSKFTYLYLTLHCRLYCNSTRRTGLLLGPTETEVAHTGHSFPWWHNIFLITTLVDIPAACASTNVPNDTSSAEEWICNPTSASFFANVICFSGKLSAHRISPKIRTDGFGHSTAVSRDYEFLRRLLELAQTSVSAGYPLPNANFAVF